MENFFSLNNPIMAGILKVMNCLLIGMLYLLCSLPIVTIAASTSALYYTVHKNLKQDRGYPANEFFHSFRENLKQCTYIWIGMLFVSLVFVGDIAIMKAIAENGHMWANSYVIFQGLLLLEMVYAIYVFAYCARIHDSIPNILKNAVFLMIKHPGSFFGVTAILLLGSVIVFILPPSIVIMPVVMMWFISILLEKLFYRYMRIEDKQIEEENQKYIK